LETARCVSLDGTDPLPNRERIREVELGARRLLHNPGDAKRPRRKRKKKTRRKEEKERKEETRKKKKNSPGGILWGLMGADEQTC